MKHKFRPNPFDNVLTNVTVQWTNVSVLNKDTIGDSKEIRKVFRNFSRNIYQNRDGNI